MEITRTSYSYYISWKMSSNLAKLAEASFVILSSWHFYKADMWPSFLEGISQAARQFLRRSFSTLNLTSKNSGRLSAVINFFTVVFLLLTLTHSLSMWSSSFLLAFLDHRWSLSLAWNKRWSVFLLFSAILTSLYFSFATLAISLFSFLAKAMLSLWTILLLLISYKTSSQFPKTKQNKTKITQQHPKATGRT